MTLEVDSLDLLDAVVLLRRSAAQLEKVGVFEAADRHTSLARGLAQSFADAGLFPALCLELGVRPSSALNTADRALRSRDRANTSASTQDRTSAIAARR